jgi:hypothetical protein
VAALGHFRLLILHLARYEGSRPFPIAQVPKLATDKDAGIASVVALAQNRQDAANGAAKNRISEHNLFRPNSESRVLVTPQLPISITINSA